jgi:hypothetical protein
MNITIVRSPDFDYLNIAKAIIKYENLTASPWLICIRYCCVVVGFIHLVLQYINYLQGQPYQSVDGIIGLFLIVWGIYLFWHAYASKMMIVKAYRQFGKKQLHLQLGDQFLITTTHFYASNALASTTIQWCALEGFVATKEYILFLVSKYSRQYFVVLKSEMSTADYQEFSNFLTTCKWYQPQ